jgi:antitoxin component YwqK of YwqJK toxin-antitoxin module
MNIGRIASRIYLVVFLLLLAPGLFLVVAGGGYASEGMGQSGGGLVVLFGSGLAGLGYFVIAASVLGAGIPWAVTAYLSRADSQRDNNSNESDPGHAENGKPDGPQSTVGSKDIRKSISAAWQGHERLWIVFWVYFWLIGNALSVGSNASAGAGFLAEGLVLVVAAVWLVWVVAALWRCSFNVRRRGWGYVARTLTIFTVAILVIDPYRLVIFPEFRAEDSEPRVEVNRETLVGVDRDALVNRDRTYYEANSTVPFSGLALRHNEYGEVSGKENFKDGKLDGVLHAWHRNGQLAQEESYKDGRLDGLSRYWHNNGQLGLVEYYKNGSLVGPYTRGWYKNGQLSEEATLEDATYVGKSRTWYENGQLKSETTMDGKDNVSQYWNWDGNLVSKQTYENGKLEGLSWRWYDNGQLEETRTYKQGKLNGLSESWSPEGEPYDAQCFKDDQLVSLEFCE